MLDSPVTRVHKPNPQPTLDINPASTVKEYRMDVAAYLAEKYPNLPKPETSTGTVVGRILPRHREKAAEMARRRKRVDHI